jgi:hypothetical protein
MPTPFSPKRFQFIKGFHVQAFGVGIHAYPGYPGQLSADFAEYVHQPLLWDDQCVAIAQKHAALALAVGGGKGDVRHDDFIGFDLEPFPPVGAAEGALVA